MTKFGIYNDLPKISFDTHLIKLHPDQRKILIELRNFVRSIGDKVIEDIRPHRIVYSKTLAFRNFLDVQPTTEELIIATRKNRKEIPVIHKISNKQDLEKLKQEIILAYENID
jgi:midasin (ATPase involved in ribosome maturation)